MAVESLYIHIPFCLSKCPYCAFSSFPINDQLLFDRYTDALVRQIIRENIDKESLQTVFFGGGTPSTLSISNFEKILGAILQRTNNSQNSQRIEISVEVNPKTVSYDTLRLLKALGVNRLSIGVQSFNDKELKLLSRPYCTGDVKDVLDAVFKVGFTNVSIDLMYGLPFQTVGSWENTLTEALGYPVHHLSMYQLTIEPDSPFETAVKNKKLVLPSEEEIEALDVLTVDAAAKAGFERYEISNYCKPGYQCRHNLTYWTNTSYYGVGAGAVSYLDGVRAWNVTDPHAYIARVNQDMSVISDSETLDVEARMRETVIMGLRLTQGVSIPGLNERFGIDCVSYYGNDLNRLINSGFLIIDSDFLRLTSKGLPLANSVMAELV